MTRERFISEARACQGQLRRVPPPAVDLMAPEALHMAGNEESDAAFRHEDLKRALARIPEKERTAIVLHYFEDLPVKEIAVIMDIPVGTVKYYLSVGRGHLKEHIRL